MRRKEWGWVYGSGAALFEAMNSDQKQPELTQDEVFPTQQAHKHTREHTHTLTHTHSPTHLRLLQRLPVGQ